MMQHLFFDLISLPGEFLKNGIIIACDGDDQNEIQKILFDNSIRMPRVACFNPSVGALYSNHRTRYGIVVNIGDQGTHIDLVNDEKIR